MLNCPFLWLSALLADKTLSHKVIEIYIFFVRNHNDTLYLQLETVPCIRTRQLLVHLLRKTPGLNWIHWRLYPQWPVSCTAQWPATLFPNNIHKEKAVEAEHFHVKLPLKVIYKNQSYICFCANIQNALKE